MIQLTECTSKRQTIKLDWRLIQKDDEFLKNVYDNTKTGENVIFELGDCFDSKQKAYISLRLQVCGFTRIQMDDRHVTCSKPTYDKDSFVAIKLEGPSTKVDLKSVWKLDNVLDDEFETIDPDSLLDDDDIKVMTPVSIKSCGDAAKKKKACKNCSCGLAEQLSDMEKKQAPINQKSSCGSVRFSVHFKYYLQVLIVVFLNSVILAMLSDVLRAPIQGCPLLNRVKLLS